MAVEGKAGATPRDRYAELLVVIVVILALIVAWGVKAGAEARAVHVAVGAFKASYGHNWIRKKAAAPAILTISDPGSGSRFQTTIVVQKLESAGSGEQTARTLNQARLQDKELFQVLDGETIQWRGRDTYRNHFAYVHVSPDLLNPTVPVVLHGVDYILRHGQVTYVITLLADENAYDDALVEFERFLESVTPG
jgi:hypothetical protein